MDSPARKVDKAFSRLAQVELTDEAAELFAVALEYKRQRDDLAALSRRFIHRITSSDRFKDAHKMAELAMEYLEREGLQGSVLRAQEPFP
jgi:hypothetical protein